MAQPANTIREVDDEDTVWVRSGRPADGHWHAKQKCPHVRDGHVTSTRSAAEARGCDPCRRCSVSKGSDTIAEKISASASETGGGSWMVLRDANPEDV